VAVKLPELSLPRFADELRPLSPEPLTNAAIVALHAHYEELRRWSRTLSLIGPGTAKEVVERHFGESLAALPWLPEETGELVDAGSGAGFPGLVLAAARPGWRVTLVEARERKWAFLQAACRRAGLSCQCLNVRVGPFLPAPLPAAFHAVSSRALKLPPETLRALAERLVDGGRFLLWTGEESPEVPAGWVVAAEHRFAGSRARRLLVVERR
jgi:16S rRNA (guanine527-N7)-methyltransferase